MKEKELPRLETASKAELLTLLRKELVHPTLWAYGDRNAETRVRKLLAVVRVDCCLMEMQRITAELVSLTGPAWLKKQRRFTTVLKRLKRLRGR